MGKSIRLSNDIYWDTKGIVHNKKKLNVLLDNLKGIIAFEGLTQATIDFPESVENYEYIDIEHTRDISTTGYSTTRVYAPFNKNVGLFELYCGADEYSSITPTIVNITGDKLSFVRGKVLSFTKTAGYLAYSTSMTNITKVICYKKIS